MSSSTEIAGDAQWQLESWSRPAGAVGGDFVIKYVDQDVLRVWLADVTGHGVEAAKAAETARGLLTPSLAAPFSLEQIRSCNRAIFRAFEGERAIALTAIEIGLDSGRAWIVNCGNPALLVRRKDSNKQDKVRSSAMPLGLLVEPEEWMGPRAFFTSLRAGDELLAFTDGLLDEQAHGARFGWSRVIKSFVRSKKNSTLQLANEVLRFSDSFIEQDDITVLSVRRGRARSRELQVIDPCIEQDSA